MYAPFQVFALRCIAGAQLWQAVVAVACCKRQTGASNSSRNKSIDYLPRTGLCLSSSSYSSSSSSSALSIFPTLYCCCALLLCVCLCVCVCICNVVCNFCLRFLSSRLFCCCVSDTQRQQLQLHLLPLAAILLHKPQQATAAEGRRQHNKKIIENSVKISRFASQLCQDLLKVCGVNFELLRQINCIKLKTNP